MAGLYTARDRRMMLQQSSTLVASLVDNVTVALTVMSGGTVSYPVFIRNPSPVRREKWLFGVNLFAY